jgi:hypothetical protein
MNTLLNIPLPQAIVWGLIGLLGIALTLFLAVLEGRHFAGLNLRPAWLRLRLTSLPILALAIGAVWLTVIAGRSAGLDPLAVAYAALFSVGAFVYFVLHLLAGRLCGLGRGHAAWIAFSGLVLIGVVPALGGTLFPFADLALKIAKESRTQSAPSEPSPFAADGRRFRLPDARELIVVRFRAPAGVTLDRVDMEQTGHRSSDVLRMSTASICRKGQDLHLAWPGGRPLPVLHAFWRTAAGEARQSRLEMPAPTVEPAAFAPRREGDDLVLPAPLTTDAFSFLWNAREGAPVLVDGLRRVTPESECAGERIRLPDLPGRGRPDAFRLRVDHTPATGPTWYDFPNPVQEKQS